VENTKLRAKPREVRDMFSHLSHSTKGPYISKLVLVFALQEQMKSNNSVPAENTNNLKPITPEPQSALGE
jgi:hypothetical protein